MVWYGARLFSRNFLGLVTFYVQLITNILKQLIFKGGGPRQIFLEDQI